MKDAVRHLARTLLTPCDRPRLLGHDPDSPAVIGLAAAALADARPSGARSEAPAKHARDCQPPSDCQLRSARVGHVHQHGGHTGRRARRHAPRRGAPAEVCARPDARRGNRPYEADQTAGQLRDAEDGDARHLLLRRQAAALERQRRVHVGTDDAILSTTNVDLSAHRRGAEATRRHAQGGRVAVDVGHRHPAARHQGNSTVVCSG